MSHEKIQEKNNYSLKLHLLMSFLSSIKFLTNLDFGCFKTLMSMFKATLLWLSNGIAQVWSVLD